VGAGCGHVTNPAPQNTKCKVREIYKVQSTRMTGVGGLKKLRLAVIKFQ